MDRAALLELEEKDEEIFYGTAYTDFFEQVEEKMALYHSGAVGTYESTPDIHSKIKDTYSDLLDAQRSFVFDK